MLSEAQLDSLVSSLTWMAVDRWLGVQLGMTTGVPLCMLSSMATGVQVYMFKEIRNRNCQSLKNLDLEIPSTMLFFLLVITGVY
jgi:hypothetical protein